jgi:hypothetical protein
MCIFLPASWDNAFKFGTRDLSIITGVKVHVHCAYPVALCIYFLPIGQGKDLMACFISDG